MEPNETVPFFQTFNFDTLLALLSCIAGIVALFLGGSALSKISNSFNDKKEFKDNSNDQSQKAAGNIYNLSFPLANMNNDNFPELLLQLSNGFVQQNTDNLHKIIDKAIYLIHETKVSISQLTKIDWINIYFECAKNASDTYMQTIWAKVLAKELETPNSFSFKTLDVLKNMSSDDFKLFERLCSLQVNGYILGNNFTDHYIKWVDVLNLSDWGLVNLNLSKQSYNIEANSYRNLLICDNRLIIYFINESNTEKTIQYNIYLLTKASSELLSIADFTYQREYAIEFAREIKDKCKAQAITKLYDVTYVKGEEVSYIPTDLLS